jgi:hypothetical protein
VLKTSKIGLKPDADPFNKRGRKILEHGFNSPFEEIALALELNKKELPSIYPRAIYMTGSIATILEEDLDNSRYVSHEDILVPNKQESILKKHHDYIILWGYWNGTDEMLAAFDGNYFTPISALNAYRHSIISRNVYFAIMEKTRDIMLTVSVEDLNFRGTHILLTLNENRKIVEGKDGLPVARLCNLEYLKRTEPSI